MESAAPMLRSVPIPAAADEGGGVRQAPVQATPVGSDHVFSSGSADLFWPPSRICRSSTNDPADAGAACPCISECDDVGTAVRTYGRAHWAYRLSTIMVRRGRAASAFSARSQMMLPAGCR